MADPTALIAGPYTPPRPQRGMVYDAVRCRWAKVGGYHPTTFGGWPARGGNKQTRPIVCEELRRAVETESASAVAHHWRVSLSTVVRWRQKFMADPRNEVPGTVELHRQVSSETVRTPEHLAAMREAAGAYTADEDEVIRSGGIPEGRTAKGVAVRRSRLGIAGPTGRPASVVAERYGCWRVTGPADPTAGGELRYHAVCVHCGATRTTTAAKLRRSEGTARCSACPK